MRRADPGREGARATILRWQRLAWAALLPLALGCGTTRSSSTPRTATEQLLLSHAIDHSVSQLDFRFLAGQPVFLDAQYLNKTVDSGYLISSLRQHLLACGCLLEEKREEATYIVEARSGGVGTDQHNLLVGIPQTTVPAFVPGQPTQIPEIPFAKKTDQQGIAKIAVFAYNRKTGAPVWQSGVIQSVSTAKDLWLFGAGPFQNGNIRKGTTFAGQPLPLPLPTFIEDGEEELQAPVVPVTQAALWSDKSGRAPASGVIRAVAREKKGPGIKITPLLGEPRQ
jgi:hypothetical protein